MYSRVELSGGLAGVVEALLRRQFRKAIATENEGFRVAAEVGPSLTSACRQCFASHFARDLSFS